MAADLADSKLPGDKKKKKKKPTLRFELDLPDSTDTSFPEYSYIELVRENVKEKISKGQNDPLCQNLIEEEEEKERDEAKAIAQYFEIKYGANAAGKKRKRKDKIRDLVGAGYGYDENDPFVDDSEAYDEIVPATMTTQHGGFYINTGKLNFRAVSDDSDAGTSSDDSIPLSHHVAKKKKKLSSESSSEFKSNGGVNKKKKKKLKPPKDPSKKKLKMSLNGKDKVAGLKQRTKKIKSKSLAQKLVAKAKAQQMMNASSAAGSAHSTNGVQQFRKFSSDSDSSVLKLKTGEISQLENRDLAERAKQATKAIMSVGSSKTAQQQQPSNGVNTTPSSTAKTVNHQLPPNLPQMLGDKIESLKKIAQSNEDTGKMKFFSHDVNKILLGIEESAQVLPNKERQGMYQHLAQHLPCSKDTLLKRVKKLHEGDSDQQLKGPIEKLKAAIDAVMDSQIEAYNMECDSIKVEKLIDKTAAASTDEDDENEDRSLESSGEKKRNYAPRRKFKWDDNLRILLCDVVSIKVNYMEKFKSRLKQGADEYLKNFLETTIKPLWPKQWMQTRTLLKESRSAHERLTNTCPKQKKAASSKKTPSSSVKVSEGDGVRKDVKIPSLQLGNLNEDLKSQKKQLQFHSYDSNKNRTPILSANPKSTSANVIIPTTPKTSMIDLTSGGMEMVASISSDEFAHSQPSQPKTAARVTPKDSNWNRLPSCEPSQKPSKNATATIASSPLSTTAQPVSKSLDRRQEPVPKLITPNMNIVPQIDANRMQEYASGFVKMMMSGKFSSASGVSSNTYLDSTGIPNLDALSHILGESGSSAKPPTIKTDDKFQFKIASTGNSSQISKRTHKSFQQVEPTKKQPTTRFDPTSWSQPINSRVPTDEAYLKTKYSTAQNLPLASPAIYKDNLSSRTPSSSSSMNQKFVVSPENSIFLTPRKQKAITAVTSNSIQTQSVSYDSKTQKMNRSPNSVVSSMQQLPLSRSPYHHPVTSPIQSQVPTISPSHPMSPIVLSPYSSAGLVNPFSAGFSSQVSPYPVHKYPSASGQPLNYHGLHSYPQVTLVDVKGKKGTMKQPHGIPDHQSP